MEPSMELDSGRNHEDVGRPECAPSLAQLTREWRAQWRAALILVNFSLQIGTSASSLRIRVRRFDSSRGHSLCTREKSLSSSTFGTGVLSERLSAQDR